MTGRSWCCFGTANTFDDRVPFLLYVGSQADLNYDGSDPGIPSLSGVYAFEKSLIFAKAASLVDLLEF